jgi:hypothetical protein
VPSLGGNLKLYDSFQNDEVATEIMHYMFQDGQVRASPAEASKLRPSNIIYMSNSKE